MNIHIFNRLWWSALFLLLFFTIQTAVAQDPGQLIISKSLEALGGKEKLKNLKTLKLHTYGHTYRLEQSERPDGPLLVMYEKNSFLIDFEERRLNRKIETLFISTDNWNRSEMIISNGAGMRTIGGRNLPMDRESINAEVDKWLLLPDRAVLAAAESKEVTLQETTTLQGVEHHVVSYRHDGNRYTLFLNAHTHMPTAIETENPSFVDIWGEIRYRTYFSYWFMLPGGIPYPYQFDTFHGDQPYQTKLVTKVAFNVETGDSTFVIPEKIKAASRRATVGRDWRSQPLGWQRESIKKIAPGVTMIPGPWYTTIVRQPDGLVIIEAPISSEYSEQVLDEAEKRFPNLPVKAVINTSDAWPHIGGIRAYAARGIPIYTHPLNKKILSRLVKTPYENRPDSLEKNFRSPLFREVDSKTVIGEGDHRLELYPVRGEGGERMIMAYFPSHNLLYGSDLVQYLRNGKLWNIQYAVELKQAVTREKLNVDRVFAMHTSPTAWDSVMKEVNAFLEQD